MDEGGSRKTLYPLLPLSIYFQSQNSFITVMLLYFNLKWEEEYVFLSNFGIIIGAMWQVEKLWSLSCAPFDRKLHLYFSGIRERDCGVLCLIINYNAQVFSKHFQGLLISLINHISLVISAFTLAVHQSTGCRAFPDGI